MKLRSSGRKHNQLRAIELTANTNPYAEGSCTVKFGNTEIICTASVDEKVPAWLRYQKRGWLSAEYTMLPRSTHTRKRREAAPNLSGRSSEIQRLIGRSLRAVTNLELLGERQILLDCDVIVADGGTRTAAITGGWVAVLLACQWLKQKRKIDKIPIIDNVAAISCGVVDGRELIDLDYSEDSHAATDANFVMTGSGKFVEIQGTAEKDPFDDQTLQNMISLAKTGISELICKQNEIVRL